MLWKRGRKKEKGENKEWGREDGQEEERICMKKLLISYRRECLLPFEGELSYTKEGKPWNSESRGETRVARGRGGEEGIGVMQSSSRPSRRNLSSLSYETLFFSLLPFNDKTRIYSTPISLSRPRLDRFNLFSVHSHPLRDLVRS